MHKNPPAIVILQLTKFCYFSKSFTSKMSENLDLRLTLNPLIVIIYL